MRSSFIAIFIIALCVFRAESAIFTLPQAALTLCAQLAGNCDLTSTTLNIFGLLGLPGAGDDVVLSASSSLFLSISKATTWKSLVINGTAASTSTLNIAGVLTLVSDSSIGAYSSVTIAAGGAIQTTAALSVAANAALTTAAGAIVNITKGLTVAGNASFAGAVSVVGGLSLQSTSAVSFSGSSVSTIDGTFTSTTGSVLTIESATNVTATGGATLGGIAIIKGNFVAQTAAGLKFTTGGILKGVGNIVGDVYIGAGANISAGLSPGTVFINGDLHLDASSNTVIEAESTTSYDKIICTGTAYINGILAASFINGYKPQDLQNFNGILGYTKYQGKFNLVIPEGGYFFTSHLEVSYNALSTDMKFVYNSGSNMLLGVLLMIVMVLAM